MTSFLLFFLTRVQSLFSLPMATNVYFTLLLNSCIVKFELENMPKDINTLRSVIWTVVTTSGETRSAILNLNVLTWGQSSVNLTAYLAFDPTVMNIAAGRKIKVTVIGSDDSYEWSTTVQNGKNYEAGKRYTGTINNDWTTAKVEFRYTIIPDMNNRQYKIRQEDVSSISPGNLTINWGDGKPNTTIVKGDTLSQVIASHVYSSINIYTITITSDQVDPTLKQIPQLTFFNKSTGMGDKLLRKIIDPFPNMGATDLGYCFGDCTGLNTIPAGLFQNNNQVTSFNHCFVRCTLLTSIPEVLFSNNPAATDFVSCFRNCINLTLRSDIFPDPTTNPDFFANRTMSFGYCFYNVGSEPSATAGTAPELWQFTGGGNGGATTWYISSCFENANVTNYNAIPNNWK